MGSGDSRDLGESESVKARDLNVREGFLREIDGLKERIRWGFWKKGRVGLVMEVGGLRRKND